MHLNPKQFSLPGVMIYVYYENNNNEKEDIKKKVI